jgi:hypothetical protein
MCRHVSAARSLDDESLDDNGEAAIIFDVLSTHVKIKSLAALDNDTDPIRSMAQLENGSTGTAEWDSTPKRKTVELFAAAQVRHERTKCATSRYKPVHQYERATLAVLHPRMARQHTISVSCMKDR